MSIPPVRILILAGIASIILLGAITYYQTIQQREHSVWDGTHHPYPIQLLPVPGVDTPR